MFNSKVTNRPWYCILCW